MSSLGHQLFTSQHGVTSKKPEPFQNHVTTTVTPETVKIKLYILAIEILQQTFALSLHNINRTIFVMESVFPVRYELNGYIQCRLILVLKGLNAVIT